MSSDKIVAEVERIVLARIEANKLIIPAMPGTATRCLELLRGPDAGDFTKLVRPIEGDPILAMLVMRAAGAAALKGSAIVRSLEQALPRLGVDALRSMITEYAVHELFRSSDPKIRDANNRVWQHSLVVAMIARDIGALVGNAEPDTCYLGGLLHDIGKPVLAAMLLEIERMVTRSAKPFVDATVWSRVVEAGHRAVGVALAQQWRLPDALTEAIRDCGDYDMAERGSISNVIRLANALAKREGFTTAAIDKADIDALVMVGTSMLGTDAGVLDRVIEGVRPRIPQVA